MTQKFFWQSRDALPGIGRAFEWLRDGLAALPEPWTVLASRRRSGADGPPWVRYVVLHPAKGVALVDVDPTEPAVAPFEDFFEHTGLAAFQSGTLPVVAVTLPRDGSAPVAETIDAAFAETSCQFGNPYWCEAIVELLLTTQELRLTRLRRRAPRLSKPDDSSVARAPSLTGGPVATSALQVDAPASSVFAEPAPLRRPVAAREHRVLDSHGLPRLQTWRSWPTLPVTAAAIVLAIAAALLVSHEASPPTHDVAAVRALERSLPAASAHADARPSVAVATASPPPTISRASEGRNPVVLQIPMRKTTLAARRSPRTIVRQPLPDRDARQTPQRTSPGNRERRMAAATPLRPAPGTACADVLHPNRPGGWRYHGPPVSGCLPIRFFGLIGMR